MTPKFVVWPKGKPDKARFASGWFMLQCYMLIMTNPVRYCRYNYIYDWGDIASDIANDMETWLDETRKQTKSY